MLLEHSNYKNLRLWMRILGLNFKEKQTIVDLREAEMSRVQLLPFTLG